MNPSIPFLPTPPPAVLIGPSDRIRAIATENHIDLTGMQLIDVPHSHATAAMDAAALAKMADRGQITCGLVDGPMAFDNAVSMEAAKTKEIRSTLAMPSWRASCSGRQRPSC